MDAAWRWQPTLPLCSDPDWQSVSWLIFTRAFLPASLLLMKEQVGSLMTVVTLDDTQ